MLDLSLCLDCSDVGGVGGEWVWDLDQGLVGGLGPGTGRTGWCYVLCGIICVYGGSRYL